MADPKIVILEKSLNQLRERVDQSTDATRKDQNISGGTTITYTGFAYPGTAEVVSAWAITKTTIVVAGADTTTTVEFPINAAGNADTGKKFKWSERKTPITYK